MHFLLFRMLSFETFFYIEGSIIYSLLMLKILRSIFLGKIALIRNFWGGFHKIFFLIFTNNLCAFFSGSFHQFFLQILLLNVDLMTTQKVILNVAHFFQLYLQIFLILAFLQPFYTSILANGILRLRKCTFLTISHRSIQNNKSLAVFFKSILKVLAFL